MDWALAAGEPGGRRGLGPRGERKLNQLSKVKEITGNLK